ncbi:hypothetical protein J5226_19120 [Lysobacter sp. K5869]|uniref:hypothetical protein n=1 Tax=Lysobacter sp. K5869 TaxID=2820808 RepID=UPI001C060FAD|nr:hypothetical protein [Lysobacter sp. K5869]QWP75700.1 hypothetical protein J5226_19120 [Lysobacter sp. K5869]
MNQRILRSVRLSALACALGLSFVATQASAQSAEVVSAGSKACALSGGVTVTLLGLNTTLPLPCTGQAQVTAPGSKENSALGLDIGLLGLVSVVKVDVAQQRADYTNLAGATALDARSSAAGLSLVQNLVSLEGASGTLACDSLTGSTVLQCQAAANVADVRIAGGNVITVPSPLPRDFTVPVGGSIRLVVLGLTIEVPVGGALKLNHVTTQGAGTRNVSVTHKPAQLTLGGSVQVGGLGLVGVNVEAAVSPETINVTGRTPFTAVTVD